MEYIKRHSANAIIYLSLLILVISLAIFFVGIYKSNAQSQERITVMTYNIASAQPALYGNRLPAIEKIADYVVANKIQIIGFQEIDIGTARNNGINMHAAIRNALTARGWPMEGVYAERWGIDGGSFGGSIFSRFPISNYVKHSMPDFGLAFSVTVDINGQATKVFNYHPLPQYGCKTINSFEGVVNGFSNQPRILLGDFNTTVEAGCLDDILTDHRNLCDETADTSCRDTIDNTYHPGSDTAIDFIFISKGEPMDSWIAESVFSKHDINEGVFVSDHYPVVATLVKGSVQHDPIGWLDVVNCSVIAGWALDRDMPNDSIDVHVYKDGPAGGGGTFLTSATTDVFRSGVNNIYKVEGSHGYSIPLPKSLLDGLDHSIYVYGINAGGGVNKLLSGSPKTLSRECTTGVSVPAPTPIPTTIHLPQGQLDSVSCSYITGWALDEDTPQKSIDVHIYKDGPSDGGGTFLMSTTTDQLRTGVNDLFGVSGNHGFRVAAPRSLFDGLDHEIYVYGIDSSLGNINSLLSGSPKIFSGSQCGVVAIAPTPIPKTTTIPTPTPTPTPVMTLAPTPIPTTISIPIPNASLVRAAGKSRVYYITEGGLKRWIPTPEIFLSYGNRWEDIIDVSESDIDKIPLNILIHEENNPRIYKLDNTEKRWIPTPDVFNRNNFNWREVAPVNSLELNYYETGSNIQ